MGLKQITITAALGALILGTAFFLSCTQNTPQWPGNPATGSVAPRILYKNAAGTTITLPANIKASITTMRLTLNAADGSIITNDFTYGDHSATLTGVPVGDAQLRVEAVDTGCTVIMTGNVNLTVRASATEEPVVAVAPADSTVPYLCRPVLMTASSVVLNWIVWDK